MSDWYLDCPECGATAVPEGASGLCNACGSPWLVRYVDRIHPMTERAETRRRSGMWRFRSFLPLEEGEQPVTLGEGDTPLLAVPRLSSALAIGDIRIKDEGVNPTGSFKARGISAAITRAVAAGTTVVTLPTAGNAGVATAAYAARAGIAARIFAPESTPPRILEQIRDAGAELVTTPGHIGDAGRLSRRFAEETGAFDLGTLREPYRIEGKKTMGLELAMQLNWKLPEAVVYPAGGGTGLIGMWKAFNELAQAGWLAEGTLMPRMYAVQAEGCAPIVRAWEAGAERAEPWQDPVTEAAGLRVPAPLGDRLMLRALRESGGGALAVSDDLILRLAAFGRREEGIDFAPEGGAVLAGILELTRRGTIVPGELVVGFNTGSGWLYQKG